MHHAGSAAVVEASTVPSGAPRPDRGGPARPGSDRETVERILTRLAEEVGPERYARYFQNQTRLGLENGRVDVTVPTGFVADLIGRRFGESIRKAASTELGGGADGTGVQVKFRVDRGAFVQGGGNGDGASALGARRGDPGGITGAPADRRGANGARPASLSGAPHALRYRLEDFVVGDSNRLAYSAAERLADAAGARSFSPLFIHGACGLGKTHLLQGIAARWRERDPRAVVRYTTAEQFTNEYVAAVRAGRLDAFRKSYRGVHVLCIDDVHFLANKTSTQGELLHTFDAIDLDGARVALASDEHPRQIVRLSSALVSRFLSGMVVRLEPPEPALRERIVVRLAERRGLRLDRAAVACIAGEFASAAYSGAGQGPSIRDLEGAITRVEALSRLLPETRDAGAGAGAIGVAHVRRALGLSDSASGPNGRGPRRPVRIDTIREEVCRALRVDGAELMGRGRHARVVLARSVIAHLARALTTMSYPEIARAMGRPNHSTIVTACKRIQGQMERGQNPDFGSGGADVAPELAGLTLSGLCDVLKASVLRTAWGPGITNGNGTGGGGAA